MTWRFRPELMVTGLIFTLCISTYIEYCRDEVLFENEAWCKHASAQILEAWKTEEFEFICGKAHNSRSALKHRLTPDPGREREWEGLGGLRVEGASRWTHPEVVSAQISQTQFPQNVFHIQKEFLGNIRDLFTKFQKVDTKQYILDLIYTRNALFRTFVYMHFILPSVSFTFGNCDCWNIMKS